MAPSSARGRRDGRAFGVCIAVALLLPLTACGTRWTDKQEAAVRARNAGVRQVAAGGDDTSGSSTGDTSTEGAGTDTGSSTGSGAGTGSSTGSGTGTGTGTGSVNSATGNAPCKAASTEVGVTASEIRVGSVSSLTGPVPGLGGSSAAAARAYVAYRNSTGGVCGRKIALQEADDGTDNARYRSVITELKGKVFGIAGGFALGDVGGVDVIKGSNFPLVYVPGSESAAELPTVWDMNPGFKNPDQVTGKYKFLKSQGVNTVAVAYLAQDQSAYEANLQMRLMRAVGMKIVSVQALPLSTLSYDSAARAVANSKADYMWFTAPTASNISMAKSLQDAGYKPKFPEYFVYSYGTDFAQAAGSAAEGAITWLRALPNEDAVNNKEEAAFLRWMDRIAPGEPRDAFAADSWQGAKAFFDALEALPGPISRAAFNTKLGATHTYDGGGMFGNIDLGGGFTNGCVVGLQVKNGKWVRLTPATGFICND